ncbi:tetratricopeptide repeat protein [Leptothoe sp. PORK10 BA2]|uniref:tetratricopeptide repeat protein n=1 Tax=Leptothoe sp. PORK10 BA2 TaxID=3110254 RepID=UPI002B1F3DD0|nr:tetratricopeptide repeat protein [Leptothoe sp. PORK10 BA2]MEA5462803.1 tetratricopeptide repeat protein [Leptothoe sp. PORK10 BA2]
MFPPFNHNPHRRRSRRSSRAGTDTVSTSTSIPETPDQLIDAGLVLAKQQIYQEAINFFDRALAISPNHPQALKNRALTYVHLGQTRAALVDLDRLIDLDPRNLWAFANRAVIFRDLGHYGNAISDFGHLIKHDRPKCWQWLISRGTTLKLMGHYDEALQDFNLSLKLKPNNSWAISARDEMVLHSRHYS